MRIQVLRYYVFAIVGLVAALLGVVLASRGPLAEAPLAFRFPEAARKAYRWSLTTIITPEHAGSSDRQEISYSGTLNVRVLPGRSATTLAVQLAPLHVRPLGESNPRMEAALSRSFTVEIDSLGRFGETMFPADLALADRAILDGVIRSLQVVLPARGVSQWETLEADTNGQFNASYVREAPGTVLKRRLRYSSVSGPGALSIQIMESRLRAEIDTAGVWLARAEGSERLKLGTEGQLALTQVDAQFSLEPNIDPLDPDLAVWRDVTLDTIKVPRDAPSAEVSVWDDVEREQQRTRFKKAGTGLDELMAALKTRAPTDPAFAHEFAAFLRAFPGETPRIRAMLRNVPENSAPLLFNVLGLAETAEAQDTLAAVMEDNRESKANRFRAVVALAGVHDPMPEVIARLWRMAGADSEPGLVSSSALLALGTLAPRTTGDLRTRIADRLVEGLRATDDPSRQLIYLRALDNAQVTLEPEDLSRVLGSTNVAVRAAATRFAFTGTDPVSSNRVVQLLENEREATVRLALLASLPRAPAAEPVNDVIAKALAADPDAQVRAQSVALLAAGMKAHPTNRSILQAQLQRETNRQVIVAILNSLGTESDAQREMPR